MSRSPYKDDRKACLLAALQDQKGRCFWCRCTLAVLDDIKKRPQFQCVGHYSATVINPDGQADMLYIASADHLVPQSMGGWTGRDNIVAACKPCNEDRGQLHNQAFWYVIDASGFEPWRLNACQERARKLHNQKQSRRGATIMMQPFIGNTLQGARVVKLERRKTA